MKCVIAFCLASALITGLSALPLHAQEKHPPVLSIGSKAPDFNLPGVDGKKYSLNSFKSSKIIVIVFTCNHCPTAQAYEGRIIRFANDYRGKGVAVVAISSNDPKAIRLDELGYSDLNDTFDDMKIRSREKKYNFPYLYDGETQTVAGAYGPVATPHFFILDKERKLRYEGRFDDMETQTKTPTSRDVISATEALLAGSDVPVASTKVFGCSLKWADKSEGVKKSDEEWARQPVDLKRAGEQDIAALLKNNTDKLRLINIWATWCGPCVAEFPEFVSIRRMFVMRDFEFVSISADELSKEQKVLKFLKEKQAANPNYIFSGDNKYKLIEAVDPNWKGSLPYTVLVEPGGKIVYRSDGPVNVMKLKNAIVENPIIGRVY